MKLQHNNSLCLRPKIPMSTFRSYSIFLENSKASETPHYLFPLAISFLSIISAYIIETSYRGTFEISFYGYNLEQTEDFADNLSKQIYMRKSTQQAHEYITKTIVSSESKEDITAQENCKLSELLDTESIEVGQETAGSSTDCSIQQETCRFNLNQIPLSRKSVMFIWTISSSCRIDSESKR